MKYKLGIKDIYLTLIILLPIIDSINGFLNGGGNEGGLSFGIIYRIVIMMLCIYFFITLKIKRHNAIHIVFIIFYIILITVISVKDGNMMVLMFKLILPILIIESNTCLIRKSRITIADIRNVFSKWAWLFPLTIIVPYLLRTGFSTYGSGQAGYKGFYFAQNDIGYALILCFFYVLIKTMSNRRIHNFICLGFVMLCNMLLGLKSNYIMMMISIIYTLFAYTNKKTRLWKIFSIAVVMGCILVGLKIYENEVNTIITRWQYFINTNGTVSLFFSSRNERIIPAYEYVINHYGFIGLLIGTGLGYTVSIPGFLFVEMDLFDILYQIGILGVLLIYGYYFGIYRKARTSIIKDEYKVMFVISLVISTLAGHVLETALSGMVFSMVCSALVCESKGITIRDGWKNFKS